jgi:hypothetical protein
MANSSTTTPVTHSQALDAIRVLSTLASGIPTAAPPAAFAYADTDNPSVNEYAMTSANALPALVVWLFLVTNPDFLNQVGTPTFPIADIAKATNLTPAGVNYVLSAYTRSPVKPSFMDVANQFQTLSLLYRPTNCPKSFDDILGLAGPAATIDPSAA